MTKHLYKVILFKEATPSEKSQGRRDVHYQYGLIESESAFRATEAAKKIFEDTWAKSGWKWHGCFFEDRRKLDEGNIFWL